MRSFPLTVLNGGINRLRVKGGANFHQLYDLQNGYVTNAGSIVPREGTIRAATLDSSTVGLAAANGVFNIFSSAFSTAALPANYVLNVLSNPVNTSSSPTIIWYAKPFMGFEYVVAQFSDSTVHHYWLQNNGTWTSTTDYTSSSIVLPPVLNGLAYQGVRDFPMQPLWAPDALIASGSYVEPNTATGFAYQAIAVTGSPVHTGLVEPVWPTVAGGVIQEFGDFDVSTAQGAASSPFSTASPLGLNITDRYGDSATVANSGVFATNSSTLSSLTLASTKVNTWAAGTNYAPGAVVVPTTNQGAFINAIPNGDFEGGSGAGGWTFTDPGGTAQWAYSTTIPYQGTTDITVPGGVSFGAQGAFATMTSYSLVTPGQSVTASAYVNPNNNGANLTVWIQLNWYNAADSIISSSGYQQNEQEGFGYRKVSVTAAAPTGAAHVRVAIGAGSGTNSRNAGFADLVTWNLETPSAVTNFLFEAVQPAAASSAVTEPAWPNSLGATVIDGGVTWKAIGTSIITWQAIPLMQSGLTAPIFPTTIGNTVADNSTYSNQNGYITTLCGMSWQCVDRHVSDVNCPNTIAIAIGASHVFNGSNDIVPFSAAVNPIDWTSTNNAGYLPTGLNNYGDNPAAVLALYRGNLVVFDAGGYQMWQIDPDPQNMALLDAQPVGSIYTRAAQSVANDLLFLTEVGVRNLGTVGPTANMAVGNTGQPVDPLVVAQLTPPAPTTAPIVLTAGSPNGGVSGFDNGDNPVGTVNFGTYGSIAPTTYQGYTIAALEWAFGSAGNSKIFVALKYTGTPPADNILGTVSFTGDNGAFNLAATGLTTFLVTGTGGSLYKVWRWVGASVLPNQLIPFTTNSVYTITIGQPTKASYVPLSLYYPGRGQYWLIFGPQAFVLTINGSNQKSWSRYIFPDTITDWTLNAGVLYLRSAGNLVWRFDAATVGVDDSSSTLTTQGANVAFNGVVQWPYLDLSSLGTNKMLVGIDVVGEGNCSIQVGFNQNDKATFNDNTGFATSTGVTAPYFVQIDDTVPGEPLAIPINAPSYSPILTFTGSSTSANAWSWQAMNIYFMPSPSSAGGSTG